MEGMKDYKRRIIAMKNRIQRDHTKILFWQDEIEARIVSLPCGQTIGEKGKKNVQLLDAINSAEDAISLAYYYLRQAEKIVGENK